MSQVVNSYYFLQKQYNSMSFNKSEIWNRSVMFTVTSSGFVFHVISYQFSFLNSYWLTSIGITIGGTKANNESYCLQINRNVVFWLGKRMYCLSKVLLLRSKIKFMCGSTTLHENLNCWLYSLWRHLTSLYESNFLIGTMAPTVEWDTCFHKNFGILQ